MYQKNLANKLINQLSITYSYIPKQWDNVHVERISGTMPRSQTEATPERVLDEPSSDTQERMRSEHHGAKAWLQKEVKENFFSLTDNN